MWPSALVYWNLGGEMQIQWNNNHGYILVLTLNLMGVAYKKHGSFKENINYRETVAKKPKEIAEMFVGA